MLQQIDFILSTPYNLNLGSHTKDSIGLISNKLNVVHFEAAAKLHTL